jgi:hypothetical protein
MSRIRSLRHFRAVRARERARAANASPAERLRKARSSRTSWIALGTVIASALAFGTLPVFLGLGFPDSNWVPTVVLLLLLTYAIWGIGSTSKQIRHLNNSNS